MAKPIIRKIDPFDARQTDVTIKFTYNGNQTYGSILNVYNAETMELVLSRKLGNRKQIEGEATTDAMIAETTRNMRSETYIYKGELSNGESKPMKYCANVISIDKDYKASPVSDYTWFYCLDTPVLDFVDSSNASMFPSNTDLALELLNSNVELRLSYYQAQGDDLYQLQFFLYDSVGRLQSESDIRYDVGDENLTYVFTGLDNGAISYVEAKILTVSGMAASIRRKLHTVYQTPSAYSRVYATSDNEDGIVNWWTNIIAIEPNRPSDTYEFSDGYINLLNDSITYEENFLIEGDFIISFGHRFEKTGTLLETNAFKLDLLSTGSDSYIYKLTVPGILSNYIIYSDIISGVEYHDDIIVHIRRVDGIYELAVFTFFGGYSIFERYNMYLGRQPSYKSLVNYDAWLEDITLPSTTKISDVPGHTYNTPDNEPSGVSQYSIWLGGD